MRDDKDDFFRAIYLSYYENAFTHANDDLIFDLVNIVKDLKKSNLMKNYGIECDYMKKILIKAYSKLYYMGRSGDFVGVSDRIVNQSNT